MNLLIIGNINSVHTKRFVDEFVKQGIKVFILSIDINMKRFNYSNDEVIKENDLLKNIIFFRNITKFLRFLIYSKRISAIVNKYKIDSVFSINLAYGGRIASKIKNRNKIGLSIGDEFASLNFLNIENFFKNKYSIKKTILNLDYIITGDEESFKPLFEKKNWLVNKKIIFLGSLGVHVDVFSPVNRNNDLKSELFNIEKDDILAICFREPRPHFDFECIIEKFAKLVKKYKKLYFAIGMGNADCERLMFLTKELNLEKNILFINNVDYSKLNIFIAQGDIFIDPVNLKKNSFGINNGVSQALIESMSCGLIPVISNRPGINWIIPDEAKQFIYEDMEKELDLAIEKAVIEKENSSIKDACRKAVVEKANWEKNVSFILKLLMGNNE